MTNKVKRKGHARGRSQPPASNLIGLAAACRILGIDKRQLERLEDSPLIRPAIVERDGVRWFDSDVLRRVVESVQQLISLRLQREEGQRRRRARAHKTPGGPEAGPAVAERPAAAPERPAYRPVTPDYRPPVVYSPGRNTRPQATASHRVTASPLKPPPRGVLAPQPVRAPVEAEAPPQPVGAPEAPQALRMTATAFDEWANAPLPDLPDEDEDDDEDDGDAS